MITARLTKREFKICEAVYLGLDEELTRLKERIAELEKENAELKEAQRWRNAAKETPTDETEVPVILDNGWKTTDYFEEDKGRWHYHWNTVAYWFQIPKAPEEGK